MTFSTRGLTRTFVLQFFNNKYLVDQRYDWWLLVITKKECPTEIRCRRVYATCFIHLFFLSTSFCTYILVCIHWKLEQEWRQSHHTRGRNNFHIGKEEESLRTGILIYIWHRVIDVYTCRRTLAGASFSIATIWINRIVFNDSVIYRVILLFLVFINTTPIALLYIFLIYFLVNCFWRDPSSSATYCWAVAAYKFRMSLFDFYMKSL